MRKKLLVIAAFIFIGVIVSSCSKDDSTETKYSIVGVWKHEKLFGVYEFRNDNTWYMYGYMEDYEKKDYSNMGKYTFDGKYLIRDGGFKEEITFSENGNQMIFNGKQYTRIK